jgi:hypothetical protein
LRTERQNVREKKSIPKFSANRITSFSKRFFRLSQEFFGNARVLSAKAASTVAGAGCETVDFSPEEKGNTTFRAGVCRNGEIPMAGNLLG